MSHPIPMLFLAGLLALVQFATPMVGYAAEEKSPYAGEFSGPYTFRTSNPRYPDNQRGSIRFSIAADGRIKGDCRNNSTSPATEIEVKGAIDEDGEIEVTAIAPTTTFTLKGTLAKTKKGHLKGTLSQFAGREVVGSVAIDLEPR